MFILIASFPHIESADIRFFNSSQARFTGGVHTELITVSIQIDQFLLIVPCAACWYINTNILAVKEHSTLENGHCHSPLKHAGCSRKSPDFK